MTSVKLPKFSALISIFSISALLAVPVMAVADTVLIETPLGNIEIELLKDDAPNTVENFLRYQESGKYIRSFVHRSKAGFIIQGGGYTFDGSSPSSIIPFASVENEFKLSNVRGTVAMAKTPGQPDSATSQWFINLKDNSDVLDSDNNSDNDGDPNGDNGGYTVFARVVGNGMAVADAISQLEVLGADGVFTEMPVIDYDGGPIITTDNLVMTALTHTADPVEPQVFTMNTGLNDAWYNPLTDGQGFFITVFPELNKVTLAWFTYDTSLPPVDASADLGSPGHRWLTALGDINGDTSVMDITIASGGLFDTETEVQPVDYTDGGTITLSFSNCNSGMIDYDIPSIGRQGSIPIERVAIDNAALCEALLGE